MTNPDSTSQSQGNSSSESIDLLVEVTLEKLQRGVRVNYDEINRSHPELQPELRSRLFALKHVFHLFQSSTDDETAASPASRFQNVSLVPERQALLDCPHCGTRLKVVDQYDEVTCRNCGSSIQLTPRGRPAEPGTFAVRPKQLGRFALQEVVGRGGFGIVYRARDTQLDRTVAIKLPRDGTFENDRDEQRFLREARHVAQLNHPNIVRVFEVGRDAHTPFIVSEFIDGMTLSDLINHRRLEPTQSAALMAKVASAVGYAHEKKIIHRDIKPGNILLNHDLEPFVADFGLARIDDAGEFTITLQGQVIGTPSYMSPEQVRGDSTAVCPSSDIYSLGVVFYRMLTGELPFRGSKRLMMHQIQYEEPRPPRLLNEYIPRNLETIALKAMAKEPQKRYATAHALAEDLRRAVNGEPISARPISRFEKFRRLCRRYPVAASLAFALAMLLMGTAVAGSVWAVRENVMRTTVETEKQRSMFEHARTLVYQGNQRVLQGDNVGSLPWMARGFELEQENERQETAWRIRMGTLLAHCPGLTSVRGRDVSLTVSGLSPDNRFASAGFLDGRFMVWNVADDRTVIDEDLQAEITAMAFSPDNRLVAFVNSRGEIAIGDLNEGRVVHRNTDHRERIFQLQFSTASDQLAYGCTDKITRLWKFATNEPPLQFVNGQRVVQTLFAANDMRIVSVSGAITGRQSTVNFWDPATPDRPHTAFTYPSLVRQLAIDSTGTRVLGRVGRDRLVIWRITETSITSEVDLANLGSLRHVQFLRDAAGKETPRLLLVTDEGSIRQIDIETGNPVLQMNTGIRPVAIAASSDGDSIAISDFANKVYVWSVARKSMICAPLWHKNRVRQLQFSNNGRYLMTGGQDGFAKIWDVRRESQVTRFLQGTETHAHYAITHSGERIAMTNTRNYQRLKIVSLEDFRTLEIDLPAEAGNMSFSPDDSELAVACSDGVLRIYSVTDGRMTSDTIRLDNSGDINYFVDQLTWSQDGQWIIASDLHDLYQQMPTLEHHYPDAVTLFAWERDTGQEVWRIPHDNVVTRIAVSPDNQYVAACCHDKSCRVFEMKTGSQVSDRLHDGDGYVQDCQFTQDSRSLLTACDRINQVVLWDFQNSQPRFDPMRHFAHTSTARFHPSGQYLAVATGDGVVHFWDANGNADGVIQTFGTVIGELAFSADQKMLVTGTNRPLKTQTSQRMNHGGVQLWDLQNQEMAGPLLTTDSPGVRVLFDPAGRAVVSVATDGSITIWKLIREQRTASEISDMASVLSGHEIDPDSRYAPLSATDYLQRWERVKNIHPETSPSSYSPE